MCNVNFVLFCVSLCFIRANLYYFYPIAEPKQKQSVLIQTILVVLVFAIIATIFLLTPSLNVMILGDKALHSFAPQIAIAVVFMMLTIVYLAMAHQDDSEAH